MPLYEYECEACGRRFEVIQKFSDDPIDACRQCGKGPVRKLPSSPAIQFKGSGWYITDYAKKGKDSSPAPAPSTGSESTSTTGTTTTAEGGAKSDTPSAATDKPAASSSSTKDAKD